MFVYTGQSPGIIRLIFFGCLRVAAFGKLDNRFPNRGRIRVTGAVADGHEDAGCLIFCIDLFGEMHDGLSLFIVENLNVVPGELCAKSGAKSFGDGLFCAKTAGEMGRGILEFVAVILLALREEAIQKVETVPLDAGANPIDL